MKDLYQKLYETGIIPVIKIDDAENAVPLAKALIDGGLPAAEITFRTATAADAIKAITQAFPDMLVGAGTVLTPEQADAAKAAGAQFIVSPGLNPKVVKYCVDKGIPVTPGTSNPSDVEQAIGAARRIGGDGLVDHVDAVGDLDVLGDDGNLLGHLVSDAGSTLGIRTVNRQGDDTGRRLARDADVEVTETLEAERLGGILPDSIALEQRGDVVGQKLARRELVVVGRLPLGRARARQDVHARLGRVGVAHDREAGNGHDQRTGNWKHNHQLHMLLEQLEQFEQCHRTNLSLFPCSPGVLGAHGSSPAQTVRPARTAAIL